jgi:hypothetical protein
MSTTKANHYSPANNEWIIAEELHSSTLFEAMNWLVIPPVTGLSELDYDIHSLKGSMPAVMESYERSKLNDYGNSGRDRSREVKFGIQRERGFSHASAERGLPWRFICTAEQIRHSADNKGQELLSDHECI